MIERDKSPKQFLLYGVSIFTLYLAIA